MQKNRSLYFFKLLLWILLIQALLINISAAIYAYKFTHFYKYPSPWNIAHPKNIFEKTWLLFKGPSFGKDSVEQAPPFPYKKVIFTTGNGLSINAWYATTPASKGTVVLFHGLTSNKSFYRNEAALFRSWGYNILLVDFRGHGHSEGTTTSIGYDEAEEVNLAYQFLTQQGEKRIFLFGGSMGAVAVARAIAIYGLKPAGAILEMPFDGLIDHVKGRGRSFGFPQAAFAYPVTFWIGVENNFPSFSHRTSLYAKGINCPVLVQAAEKDHLVMQKEIEVIYKNLAGPYKRLVMYPDAGHSSLLAQNPLLWKRETEQFLQTY